MSLFLFTAAWIFAVYLFNSALARRFKRVHIPTALLYITTVALIGVFGEVFADSLYNAVVGHPLWLYHFLPVHHAYTSMYSVVVWGLYGFYLYLLHDHLAPRKYSINVLAAIICVEAIILELLFNFSYKLTFGDYFFYYLPSDLWHFSTLQAIPFYFLAGRGIIRVLKKFTTEPLFFIAMNMAIILVFIFLAP